MKKWKSRRKNGDGGFFMSTSLSSQFLLFPLSSSFKMRIRQVITMGYLLMTPTSGIWHGMLRSLPVLLHGFSTGFSETNFSCFAIRGSKIIKGACLSSFWLKVWTRLGG